MHVRQYRRYKRRAKTIAKVTAICASEGPIRSPIFNWVSRPQEGFHAAAAAGIIVLLILLLSMNAVAILRRNKFQKRLEG